MATENCTAQDRSVADGGEMTALVSAGEALHGACCQFHSLRNIALAVKALVENIDDVWKSDEGCAAVHLCALLEKQAIDCARQADEAWLAINVSALDPTPLHS